MSLLHRSTRLSISLLAFLVSLPIINVHAEADTSPVPQPFIAHYKGRANGLAVDDLGVRELKSLGEGRFQLQYRAEAMLYSLEETSVFELVDDQIRPLTYRSVRGTFFNRRRASMDFDWNAMTINYQRKDRKVKYALEHGTQDPLSGSIALTRQLKPDVKTVEYKEAGKKSVDTNRLVLVDQPTLSTDAGEIPTWHLRRIHNDDKRETEIWLHRDHPAIPVRVHQIDDGDEFQLDLVRFKLL